MRRRQVSRFSRRGVESSTPLSGFKRAGFKGTDFDGADFEEADSATEDPAKRRTAARHTAIGLLARREHAQSEMRRKLAQRGYDPELTHAVVDELTRQRLLSDDRFAESFIRARAERGQGPVRLRAELRQLRLVPELIEQHLLAAQVDWAQSAADIRTRRFGATPPASLAERAKQVRFLQYRGFTADQIRFALRHAALTEEVEAMLDADDADLPDNYSQD